MFVLLVENTKSEGFEKGEKGCIDLAKLVIHECEKSITPSFAYSLSDNIETKIKNVSRRIYGAKDVIFSENALKKLQNDYKTVTYDNR